MLSRGEQNSTMNSNRDNILNDIAAGAAYELSPVRRIQHTVKWRGYYNAVTVRCDGQSAFIPLGMVNQAIARGQRK